MEQAVLCSIAIFLLAQGGCLIWVLSDLTTRTKITADQVQTLTLTLSGFADKYVTQREIGTEISTLKDSIAAAHRRLDEADHNNCKNFEHK